MEMNAFLRKDYPGGYPEKIAQDERRLAALRANLAALEAERDSVLANVAKSAVYTLAANRLDGLRMDIQEVRIDVARLEADIAYDKAVSVAETEADVKAAYDKWAEALAAIPADPRVLTTHNDAWAALN